MATIRRYRRSDAERSPEKKHRAALAQVIAAPLVLVAVDNGEMAGV